MIGEELSFPQLLAMLYIQAGSSYTYCEVEKNPITTGSLHDAYFIYHVVVVFKKMLLESVFVQQ